MKKRFALFLIFLVALFLLVGCAKEKVEEKVEEESEESHVASSADMTEVEDVVEEGMVPVYASDIVEGTYPVEMVSSSSMFKADHCELVVDGDEKLYI